MASAYLKVAQDLKDRACHACRGTGKTPPNPQLSCTTCYGTGFQSAEATHDVATLRELIGEMMTDFVKTNDSDTLAKNLDRIEAFVTQARVQAIGWTWTEACSQYDKGLDPRNQEVPQLLERADADLNPIADKNARPA